MVINHRVTARSGEVLPIRVQTICLHGDTPGAAENAASLRAALESRGVAIRP